MRSKSFYLIGIAIFLALLAVYPVQAKASSSPDNSPSGIQIAQTGQGSPMFSRPAGAAPAGQRWVPGHFETNKDGQQIWIRGHYAPIDESTPAENSGTPAPATPGVQQNNVPAQTEGKGNRLPGVNQNGYGAQGAQIKQGEPGGPGGNASKWIPGHFEEVNGSKIWIRGHNAGESGTVAGPPAGGFNPPAANESAAGASAAGGAAPSPANKTVPANAKCQKWAVVIGISKYKYAAENLPEIRYAARDAEEFCNFLRSPGGGSLPADHIIFLRDEEASLQNIRHAFFEFLKQALEEDLVTIYFAGHGTPEEDNPKNLYLVAYDTKPDQLASTAFSMWDIDTALTRYVKSEKVIFFADACHSAGISTNIATRDINRKNMISAFLLDMARAKKGRAFITASEAGELSQESIKWDGGHGVFTCFLLRALKGEADDNNDHIVSLGELIDFVSENVRRATNNTQHPHVSSTFDRNIPVSTLNQ